MSSPTAKPDHASHGQTRKTDHNTWTEDTKTKTAKCRSCGLKITVSAWHCNLCGCRLCSACCSNDPTGIDYDKQSSRDMLVNGCWCRYPSGINPDPRFRILQKKPPPKQEEQMAKDRAAKQKAMATSARKKAEREEAKAAEGSSRAKAVQVDRSEPTASDDRTELSDDEELRSPTSLRPRIERKRYTESGSEEGSLDANESDNKTASPNTQRKQGQTKTQPSGSSNNAALPPTFVHALRKKDERGQDKHKSKRTSDVAQMDPDQKQGGASAQTKNGKKAKKSGADQDQHTLIVGAGIVGLFMAYELATHCENAGIEHKITVVEIRSKACQLASGQCAGFITTRGVREMDQDQQKKRNSIWTQLFDKAQTAWIDLVQKAGDGNIGRASINLYYAQPVGKYGEDKGESLPKWFKPGPIHSATEDDEILGRVNTRMLSRWLQRECIRMGVDFIFGRRPEAVQQKADGKGYQVSIGYPSKPSAADSIILDCSDIVVAAGSFTTLIVDNIFNGGERAGLSNRLQEYFWLTSELLHTDPSLAAAVTIKTTDDWTDGTLLMGLRLGSTFLEIAAAARHEQTGNHESSDAIDPPIMDGRPLIKVAEDYVGVRSYEKLEVSDSGSATICLASKRAPYVGLLQIRSKDRKGFAEMPNVWLSYGFGKFGTTLAPGAARQLVKEITERK